MPGPDPLPVDPLPIDAVLGDLRARLAASSNVVLEAPPGAGKTTRVPLALLDEPWATGSILVLEPRRLAARAAAQRMATTLGEPVGATVGYRVRQERKVGPSTRIEVVTEGILIRQLQRDPELTGVSAVLFDEFHERNLVSDLGLALCLDMQQIREELRLVVMSATLDGSAVAELLGHAPRVVSQGRSHPIDVHYRPGLEVVDGVREALRMGRGDVLVFLPGEGEIRTAQRQLTDVDAEVVALYGALPAQDQDRALHPIAGRRKVILATAIAETSLTIDGVDVVVDAGWARMPRYEPGSGMTRLATVRVSAASATQRAGRAARLGPGACVRLWDRRDQLVPFAPPEMAVADLAPLALELAAWGSSPDGLRWLDRPPAVAFDRATDLLQALGALDGRGRLTGHGKRMAEIGAHPRIAHLLTSVGTESACAVAAVLDEGDILTAPPERREADLALRLDVVFGGRAPAAMSIRRGALDRVRRQMRTWKRRLDASDTDELSVGALVALAYPDRIAAQSRRGRYRLSNGRGAEVREQDPLGTEAFLAVAETDGRRDDARIFLAAGLDRAEIEALFDLVAVEVVGWDDAAGEVVARREFRLGEIVVRTESIRGADPAPALLDATRARGLSILGWNRDDEELRDRMRFLHETLGDPWPAVDDESLLGSLERWLLPHLGGARRLSDLRRLDVSTILRALLDWREQQALATLAPARLEVPSGRRFRVDYSGERPIWAVPLQELFGVTETPTVAGGRVPVLIHLLSPAGRPVQVTDDLAGFWSGSYAQVRADLRGRYPKHAWPEL